MGKQEGLSCNGNASVYNKGDNQYCRLLLP